MIDGKRSKFDFAEFDGGYDDFAVNKDKHSIEEALSIYKSEMDIEPGQTVSVGEAFVRHHAGINEDGEPCVGWWLEYEEHKTSCPVYAMHLSFSRIPLQNAYRTFVVGEKAVEEKVTANE